MGERFTDSGGLDPPAKRISPEEALMPVIVDPAILASYGRFPTRPSGTGWGG